MSIPPWPSFMRSALASEHDFVGGTNAGEKRAVYGSRKELRGGFAREENPVLEGYTYLSAQALLGADRHIGVRDENDGDLLTSSDEMANRLGAILPKRL